MNILKIILHPLPLAYHFHIFDRWYISKYLLYKTWKWPKYPFLAILLKPSNFLLRYSCLITWVYWICWQFVVIQMIILLAGALWFRIWFLATTVLSKGQVNGHIASCHCVYIHVQMNHPTKICYIKPIE